MVLFARSDVMSVSVPVGSGGCGRPGGHSRPVIKGAPAKTFKLDCPPCESFLKGDRKQKILKYHIDPKTGQSVRPGAHRRRRPHVVEHPGHDPADS